MLSNSLQTREIRFAFMFGPPRLIGRDEAMKIHGAVCDEIGHDDLSFRFSNTEPETTPVQQRGFAIQLTRAEGRGEFVVVIDHAGGNTPIRFLFTWNWPPSNEHVKEQTDFIEKAIFDTLTGDWQRALAEVLIRAQCDVPSPTAQQFMREKVLRLSDNQYDSLGTPIAMISTRIEIEASKPDVGDSISNPHQNLTIEVLREDPRKLYTEMKTIWPQAPFGGQIDLSSLRQIDRKPSEYISAAYDLLSNAVDTI